MSGLSVSRRVSIRSSLVLIAAALGIGFSVSVAMLAGQGQLRGTWVLAAVAFGGVCVLVLAVYGIARAEVHRVAEREQVAAARRMASLIAPDPARRDLFNTLEIEILGDGHDESRRVHVDVFLKDPAQFEARTTLIVGPPGSGKSTLLHRLVVQTALRTAEGAGSHWPLYASARAWTEGSHLSGWVENEMSSHFKIRRRVTSAWLQSGKSILFIDGLDEVTSVESCRRLLLRVHDWQRRPSGGKVVITSRLDQGAVAAGVLDVSKTVRLRPISMTNASRAFRDLLATSDLFGSISNSRWLRRQTEFFADMYERERATPSVLRAIERAVTDEVERSEWSGDLAQVDLSVRNESNAAKSAYLRLAELADPSVAAVALVRASILEAGAGQSVSAERTFERALELFEDLNPLASYVAASVLSPEERAVLRVLNGSRPLVEEEIVTRTRLLPSEVDATLSSLVRKGFAYVREVGHARTIFYESAIKARSDGLDVTSRDESVE